MGQVALELSRRWLPERRKIDLAMEIGEGERLRRKAAEGWREGRRGKENKETKEEGGREGRDL